MKIYMLFVKSITLLIVAFIFHSFLFARGEEFGKEKQISRVNLVLEQSSNMVDFSWEDIHSNKEFAERLLEIAKSLENFEAMKEWLVMQGFSYVSDLIRISSTTQLYVINAEWDPAVTGKNIPLAINLPWFERIMTNGKVFRIQVRYTNGEPSHATSHHIMK